MIAFNEERTYIIIIRHEQIRPGNEWWFCTQNNQQETQAPNALPLPCSLSIQ